MRSYLHHTRERICPGCEDRLSEGHPKMIVWFHDMKEKFSNIHCSWVYRDRQAQEEAFNRKASRLHYPNSAHNKTDDKGKPKSEAIDIFELIDAKAVFSREFCETLYRLSKDEYNLRWGGTFSSLGDYGHFELCHTPNYPND